MPITTLDRRTALLVIDLQQGLVAAGSPHVVRPAIANCLDILREFRKKYRPVILVSNTGTPPGRTDLNCPEAAKRGIQRSPFDAHAPYNYSAPTPNSKASQLIPELDIRASDKLYTNQRSTSSRGAFTDTDLDAFLRSKGITQLIIVGMATTVGIETTAREAYERGFNVTIVHDAVADVKDAEEGHEWALREVFPRIAETGSTEDLLELLAVSSSSPATTPTATKNAFTNAPRITVS